MNNSMRINAVLKLVVLSKYNIEWKINSKVGEEPLTPDVFEIYAYPRLIETLIEDEDYHDENKSNMIEETENSIDNKDQKDEIIFQAELDDSDIDIINDENFIKDLQADIKEKAKKEFSEFNKNNPDAKLNGERLTIKEKISDIDFSVNKINEEIKVNEIRPNNGDIKPKFVFKLDESEKGKYYTNVLDTVEKIMSEKEEDIKTSKTISEIVDEILEEEQKATIHNTNKKN